MTPILSENKLVARADHPQVPLAFRRQSERQLDRQARPQAGGFRQNADESNNIGTYALGSERIVRLQAEKIPAVAEHNLRLKRQLFEEAGPETRAHARSTNNKRARRTNIHDIVSAQFSREQTGAECSVSTNIDAAKKDDKSHDQIMKKTPMFIQ